MTPSRSIIINLIQFESNTYRGVPNVHALIKGAARQVLAIRAEGHTVDRLLVLGQSVNTNSSLNIPQSHCGVERGAVGLGKEEKRTYQIGSNLIYSSKVSLKKQKNTHIHRKTSTTSSHSACNIPVNSRVRHFRGFMKQRTPKADKYYSSIFKCCILLSSHVLFSV